MRINQDRLALEMAKACKPISALCKEAGVTQPTLSRIKSGAQNTRPVTIGRIARALGVRVEDIIEMEMT